MLVDFSVSNFRSIRKEQTLSLKADSSKKKIDNTFELIKYKNFRLLKSAVFYGANASGKTNIIRSFFNFVKFIVFSTDSKKGEKIEWYEPFKLDLSFSVMPTSYKITFINKNDIMYKYQFSFDSTRIISERLEYYPLGYQRILFDRNIEAEIKLGSSFRDKKVDKNVLENRLFLSEMANRGHEQMGEIYLYFKNIEVWNLLNEKHIRNLESHIYEFFADPIQDSFRKKLNRLIRIADTKIESLEVKIRESNIQEPANKDENEPSNRRKKREFNAYALHKMYDEIGNNLGETKFDLDEESEGTIILFILGGLIVKSFENGGLLFFDELGNTLHPKLCRFLVGLFNNHKCNPKNAQLVFATHETTLLDRDLFRKDQIWITEKDKYGSTEIFSVKDFENVRDDVPFDKWYLSGKFGGQPSIKEMEFIFGDGEKET